MRAAFGQIPTPRSHVSPRSARWIITGATPPKPTNWLSNAIDAGVATGLAIDVLESQFVGFGGVAPVMIHLAERSETHVISGVGIWPKAARIEHFQRNCGGRIPDGLLQTVVPAAPAIWIAALARFGTMSFGDVAAAAIRFARDGFPTYPFFAEILAARQAEIRRWPTTAAIFLPNGRAPQVGETFIQADLARTLQDMADQEKANARGDRIAGLNAAHDAFYRGDIASSIVRHQRENGGWLDAGDLAAFRGTNRTAVPHPLCGFRCLRLRPVVAGTDGPRGSEHPGRPRPAFDAAQFARLRAHGDRGAEPRRRRPRGVFRRSGFRRCADRRAVVERLCRASARSVRSGEGVARHAAGGRGWWRVHAALASRSVGRRASGDRRHQARDFVPVRCRQPRQRVRRHAERPDDRRCCGAGHRHRAVDVGFAWLHRERIIRRALVPAGVRACRQIRRSRSGRARR